LRELAAIWQAKLASSTHPAEREELRIRLVEVYVQILNTDPDPAVRSEIAELLLALHEATPIGARLLEAVAEAADEQGDIAIRRWALECLARHEDEQIKTRALERLGDVFDQLGDRRSAVDSWRPAAQSRASVPSEHPHARRLYERVLDTAPNDRDAAERLIELYAAANAWDRIPEVFGVVVRTDADRAAEILVHLEARALEVGARDHLVTMADEVLAVRTPYSIASRRLQRAKARALAAAPSRQSEAIATYRALLEIPSSTSSEDDGREYAAFLATIRDPATQHAERRWLYAWRARHDASPAEVLIEWAQVEAAYGAREIAVAAYRRAIESVPEDQRPPLALSAAHLLVDLDRPEEAITLLAPALTAVPRLEAAHEIAREMLGGARFGIAVANQLERMASKADDTSSVRLLSVLVDARVETCATPDARRRWYLSLLERSHGTSGVSLSTIVQGAAEMPKELALWKAAERVAREQGELGVVLHAYGETLSRGDVDSDLADALGRRMVALEAECAVDATFFVEALANVLLRAPRARWALDRIKLALGRDGEWETLFRAYDRAIAAADREDEQIELLDEAAFAARNLANDTERAIRYLGAVRALRPEDAAASLALERLYEREGRKQDLLELLGDRAARSERSVRHELRRRVAVLSLELGRAEGANAALESMLEDGASISDVADLFERVARHPGQAHAIERLYAHYESIGRIEDVIRVAETALADAPDARERSRRIREIVRFRVAAERGAPRTFAKVTARIASDVRGDANLAMGAYRALLVQAIVAWKRSATDADFEDAAEGAWSALAAIKSLLLDADDRSGASRLLERGARLRFEPRRQRTLLHEAALQCADRASGAPRALRLITEIFRDDSTDSIADSLFDRFVSLLQGSGKYEALAELWEDRARRRARRGDIAEERACWERAAALWEDQGAHVRAVVAHEGAAVLGSEESFEALTRIYASRGEWNEAATALECLCACSTPENRARRVGRLADAYIALGRTDRARACLEELLGTTLPIEDDVRVTLEAIYRRDGVWRPLAELLAADARRASERPRRAALFEEAASILASKLDAPAEAADLLERAIGSDPGEGTLRLKLAELLEQLAQWDRVVEIDRQQLALYGDRRSKERALVHHRLARALVRTDRAPDAMRELEAAAKMLPTHPAILHDLARTALDAGDLDLAERTYRSLLLVLRHPEEPFDAIGPTQVLLQLAMIASKKNDPQRAANLLESALDRALASREDTQGIERALRDIGRHDLAVRAVEARVRHTADVIARTLAIRELAESWRDRLGRDSELGLRIRGYAEAVADELRRVERAGNESFANGAAWSALLAVHACLGDEATLLAMVPLLEGAIARMAAGAERARLKVTLAKMWLDRPARSDAVIALLGSALDESPMDTEAAERLEGALEREGRFDELATLLERHLKSVGRDSPAYVPAAWRLGRALERAERRKEALAIYESLLERRPADGDAARALFERLESLGSERVADALELCVEAEPGSARALVPRLVELRDARRDVAGLVRALERGLADDPTNPALLERFVQIEEERGDWLAVTRVLCRAREAGPGDRDDRARLRRLVDAYQAMGDDREALALLDREVAREPRDAELRGLRARARESAGDFSGAVADLRSIERRDAESVDVVVEILERIVIGAAPSDREHYALVLADVLLDAGRSEAARGLLDTLVGHNPRHVGALERAAALAATERAWNRAVDAYSRLVDIASTGDPPALARFVVALADACDRAGRPDDARDALERALCTLPDDLDIAGRLERICERTADYERLSELLAARSERTSEPSAKAALLLRAASVIPEEPGAPSSARALRFVERARSVDPMSIEASLANAQLCAKLGRPHDVLEVLSEVVERNRGKRSPVLAAVYLELGKAHLALDELVEASEALKAGFAIDLRCPDLAMLLGLVAVDLDDEKTAERALLAVATLPPRTDRAGLASGPSSDDRAKAFYQLAAMANARGDLTKARAWASKAVSMSPSHARAAALLQQLEIRPLAVGHR
jgi:tetratricopeptide (TPR) repeat protein